VLADELYFDATDYPSERTSKGEHRIISVTDRDTTFRKHDDDLALDYNVAIVTTPSRIRAVVVTSGATPDCETPLPLRQQQDAGLPLPSALIMDQADGWGRVRARRRRERRADQMVARCNPARKVAREAAIMARSGTAAARFTLRWIRWTSCWCCWSRRPTIKITLR
jgi:hypothetical protein